MFLKSISSSYHHRLQEGVQVQHLQARWDTGRDLFSDFVTLGRFFIWNISLGDQSKIPLPTVLKHDKMSCVLRLLTWEDLYQGGVHISFQVGWGP